MKRGFYIIINIFVSIFRVNASVTYCSVAAGASLCPTYWSEPVAQFLTELHPNDLLPRTYSLLQPALIFTPDFACVQMCVCVGAPVVCIFVCVCVLHCFPLKTSIYNLNFSCTYICGVIKISFTWDNWMNWPSFSTVITKTSVSVCIIMYMLHYCNVLYKKITVIIFKLKKL